MCSHPTAWVRCTASEAQKEPEWAGSSLGISVESSRMSRSKSTSVGGDHPISGQEFYRNVLNAGPRLQLQREREREISIH